MPSRASFERIIANPPVIIEVAGGVNIRVEAGGRVSIEGAGALSLSTDGDLNLTGDTVNILADHMNVDVKNNLYVGAGELFTQQAKAISMNPLQGTSGYKKFAKIRKKLKKPKEPKINPHSH